MLIRRLAFFRHPALPLAVAILLLASCLSGFSDEPVEKEKSVPKPQVAPENKNLLNYRAYRPGDSIFKSSSVNLPSPTVPIPAPPPHSSRKDLELLDREKNWIFVLPGDDKKSDATEDILGTDKTFDNGKSKSVITKFLENRGGEGTSLDAKANGFKEQRLKDFGASPAFNLGNQKQIGPEALSQPGARPENLFGASGPPSGLVERWQELHSPRAEKMREEKRVQMNEFEGLFSSQSLANVNGNPLQNNLNSQAGTVSSSALDPFNRNTPPASDAFRNPARPMAGASLSTEPNINTRVFGSPVAAAPAAEPVRRIQQPAILPIPKRHF